MKKAFLAGSKGDKFKVLTDVLSIDEARRQYAAKWSDPTWCKDYDFIWMFESVKQIDSVIVAGNTPEAKAARLKASLAKAEAAKPKAETTKPKDDKPVKTSKSTLITALIAAIMFVGVGAMAEVDLTSRLAATTVAAVTTNSTSMQQPIGWSDGQVLTFQIDAKGTNAASGSLTLSFKESLNGVYWKAATKTAACATGNATNTTLFKLTNSLGTKWITVESMANTNAAAGGTITILRATAQ